MQEIKVAFAILLQGLSKLTRFIAFAGLILGLIYGMLANLFDREFFGLGPTKIEFLGAAYFVLFLGVSIGLTMISNRLVLSQIEDVGSDPGEKRK